MYDEVGRKKFSKLSIAALCLAIVSIIVFFTPSINIIYTRLIFLLTIIVGVVDVNRSKNNIFSVIAIVVGVIPFALLLVFFLMGTLFPANR